MAKQRFVVFEKAHAVFEAPVGDGAEAKIAASCRQLKRRNPAVRCLMYTENDWARTYYRTGHDFDAHAAEGWELRCSSGWRANFTEHIVTDVPDPRFHSSSSSSSSPPPPKKKMKFLRANFTHFHYDFSRAEAQHRWVRRVADAVNTEGGGAVDGVFIDGERSFFVSPIVQTCVKDQNRTKRWSQGQRNAHALLKAALPTNATILVNYPVRNLLQGFATGGMIERFVPSGEMIVKLQRLAECGVLAQVHGIYLTDEASFHVAAFLVGMGKYSYFGTGRWAGSGETACASWLDAWSDYGKPLGEPTGDARVIEGAPPLAVWTREFAGGTHVIFNGTRPATPHASNWRRAITATIWWADGTTSGDPGYDVAFDWPAHEAWLRKHRSTASLTPPQ